MQIDDIDFIKYINKSFNIKDNNPCWCGSNKNYKECHEIISLSKISQMGEIEKSFISLLKKKMCLHPSKDNCSYKIIDSHSIQNKRSISSIAIDGHVGKFIFDIDRLENFKKYQTIIPQKVGINKVSTFKGFCSYHDSELFNEIDTKIIIPTKEQSVLLSIRSLAKEIYVKTILLNQDEVMCKIQKGKNILEQIDVEERINLNSFGNHIGVRDLYIHYNKLFDIYYNKQYDQLKRVIIKIDKVPEIMCSSCIIPEYDLNGNILQGLNNQNYIAEIVSIEILSNGSDGIVQLCWLDHSNACRKFVNTILEQNDLSNTIVKLVFSFIENHVFSLNWWNNLSIIKQKIIMRYLCNDIFDDIMNINGLVSDYRKYVDWNIIEIIQDF